MQKRSQGGAFCVGIKKGRLYLETGYSKTGRSGRVEGGVYGDCGGALRAGGTPAGLWPRRVPAQPERAPPALRAPRSFRAGTDHAAYAFFTNERRTVSRCGPSTNMKKRPAGRLYICTSVILLFHPVRRKDSFLPDPVQRGWALLQNRDFLLLPPEWVPPAVLFELSGSSEPSTHFQSSR